MRNDLTEVAFVLDASGSMYHLTDDTIGGFNSVIESQKKEKDEVVVTTVIFDTGVTMLHDHINIREIEPLNHDTYKTGGCTALYDALGTTIDSIGARLVETPEEERPAQVLVVIITDGAENASKEYSFNDIKERVETQQNVYSWKFMFLGADLNSMNQAQNLGISRGMSKMYTTSTVGTQSVYTAVDSAITCTKAMAKGAMSNTAYLRAVNTALDEVK